MLITLTALIACGSMTAACASWLPTSAPSADPVRAPRVAVPEMALAPCKLTTLPTDREITWAELEAAYLLRGQQVVQCEMARRLALDTLMAERELHVAWEARRSEGER